MKLAYTCWQDKDWYLGYLNDYPLCATQGKSLSELEEMLVDLYESLKTDTAPMPVERQIRTLSVPA